MASPLALQDFPGGDLVEKGLRDLAENRTSPEALLLMVAAPRLEGLGLSIIPLPDQVESPEHALYSHLQELDEKSAYREYNSLIGRIVSFASAYSFFRKRLL